jgi:hypothetical protein
LSTSSVPSLRLEPAAPLAAACALALLALLAACAVVLSGLALALKLPLVLVVALLLLRGLRRLLEPWPLLEWDAAGQWWLHGVGHGLEAVRDSAAGPDPLPQPLSRGERGVEDRTGTSPSPPGIGVGERGVAEWAGTNPSPLGRGVGERDRSEQDTANRPDPAAAELLGAARLGPLLVLRLRVEGRRRVLLLTPGMLAAADMRRLRVRLGLG